MVDPVTTIVTSASSSTFWIPLRIRALIRSTTLMPVPSVWSSWRAVPNGVEFARVMQGGGTLDVALLLLELQTRTFLVLGAKGDPHLGGEDFDRALAAHLAGKPSDQHGV